MSIKLGVSDCVSKRTKDGPSHFDRANRLQTALMNINNIDGCGGGEEINLHCEVDDSGPVLTEEEVLVLKHSHKDATARSRIRWSDFGLALSIARILTEMQGGQFGIASRPGIGTTFSFYIKFRRSLCIIQ